MRALIALLVVLLIALQFKLWIGNGSLAEVWRNNQAVKEQQLQNAKLEERNKALDAEVQDLKQGLAAVEERARNELGMVKRNETFFQIIEENDDKK